MNDSTTQKQDEATSAASELNAGLDCRCGYSAGMVGYSGGRNGHWVIRCQGSRCPAVAQDKSRELVIERWNTMQSNDEVSSGVTNPDKSA